MGAGRPSGVWLCCRSSRSGWDGCKTRAVLPEDGGAGDEDCCKVEDEEPWPAGVAARAAMGDDEGLAFSLSFSCGEGTTSDSSKASDEVEGSGASNRGDRGRACCCCCCCDCEGKRGMGKSLYAICRDVHH